LKNLPNLLKLDVSKNEIKSLSPLQHNLNLIYLDASDNLIDYIRQTEFLREIPWLNEIFLLGNPCSKKLFYRYSII
jgi:Leucine-rich repeat (LRR) protein